MMRSRSSEEIPVALCIRGTWEYASWRVISGSTPEAESFLGWNNEGELTSCAIRIEPASRPLNWTISPFAWYGMRACAIPVISSGKNSPHIKRDTIASPSADL